MTSYERMMAVLERKIPDRAPWMEIGFHTKIAEKIIGENFASSGSGFFPMDNLTEYESEAERWIKLAKTVGLDAISCKYWIPVLAGSGLESSQFDAEGLVKTSEDIERESKKLPDLSKRNYSYGEILLKKCRKERIAGFFQTHFLIEQSIGSFGFARFCYMLYDNPKLVAELMDFYTEYSAQNIRNLMNLKPDFLLIADDLAHGQGPFVSPEIFRELFLPRYKRLADEIKCPWVFHSDGNILPIMEDLLSLGMNAIHPIEPYGTMDIAAIKRDYGDRVVLAGNLDMNIIANETPSEIRREVKWLFENVGHGGGWILSSSNSIDGGANPKNVIAMGEALRDLRYS